MPVAEDPSRWVRQFKRMRAPFSSADSWQVGTTGTVAAKNEYLDYTVIEFGSKAEISRSYNGVTATQLGGNTSLASHLARLGSAT